MLSDATTACRAYHTASAVVWSAWGSWGLWAFMALVALNAGKIDQPYGGLAHG